MHSGCQLPQDRPHPEQINGANLNRRSDSDARHQISVKMD
jgi:hypothetical protein